MRSRRSGAAPTLAAVTMVRDEKMMLPRWLAHYGSECGPDNLFVIDDNTTDGSTEGLDCSVIRVPDWGDRHFETTRMGLVSGLAATLLEVYDAVLLADADEFLVADPDRHSGLRDLLATCDAPVVGAMGLNLVHDVEREPSLDPDRPILGQRRWAKFVPLMCKPAIKRVPAPWVAGSHGAAAPFEVNPDLYLFHAKFAEVGHLRQVGDHRKALADSQGRAKETSWSVSGDDLVSLVSEITREVDPAAVRDFTPPSRELKKIVDRTEKGFYRAHGRRQVQAMRRQPMVGVPDRFHGRV